jgi:hypothetical protein
VGKVVLGWGASADTTTCGVPVPGTRYVPVPGTYMYSPKQHVEFHAHHRKSEGSRHLSVEENPGNDDSVDAYKRK